jgi:hypothetical protein
VLDLAKEMKNLEVRMFWRTLHAYFLVRHPTPQKIVVQYLTTYKLEYF